MPTAIVIDRNRVARFVDVHPDWLIRTEADPILSAVAALSAPTRDRSGVAVATA